MQEKNRLGLSRLTHEITFSRCTSQDHRTTTTGQTIPTATVDQDTTVSLSLRPLSAHSWNVLLSCPYRWALADTDDISQDETEWTTSPA